MISVIVPVYRNATLVEYSLKFLAANMPDGAELVVVDDGSDHETVRVLSGIEGARLVRHEANRGNTAAYNTGAAHARGDVLVFADSDVFVPAATLRAFSDVIGSDSRAGAVGSLLLYPYDHSIQHAGVAFDRWVLSHLFVGRQRHEVELAAVEERQAVTAALFACSRALFDTVGGFDETYRDGLEDIEFCLACRQLGYRNLMLSEHPAMHLESATRGPYKHLRRTYNYSIFFSRWSGRFSPDLAEYVRCSARSVSSSHLAEGYPAPLLNFCSTPNWPELAEAAAGELGLGLAGVHDLSGTVSEPEPIDLFRAVPLAFQRLPYSLVFVVDHFSQLSRNRFWFERRSHCDLVVDRHANVLTSTSLGHQGPGE